MLEALGVGYFIDSRHSDLKFLPASQITSPAGGDVGGHKRLLGKRVSGGEQSHLRCAVGFVKIENFALFVFFW